MERLGFGVRVDQRAKIVVVGGGFGGVNAANRLALRLRRTHEVILVDRNDYLLYTPMLADAMGRSIAVEHAAVPFKRCLRGVTFIQGEITSIDLAHRSVTLDSGRNLNAPYLLLTLGAATNYRGVEGAQDLSFTLKSLTDANNIQLRAMQNIRKAAALTAGEDRDLLLRAVVVGGGYTGVEAVTALNEFMRFEAGQQGILQKDVRVTIIEPSERLLGELPSSLAEYGRRVLESDGVAVRTGVRAVKVEAPTRLHLSDGTSLEQALLIWDTGIMPNSLVGHLEGKKGKKGGLLTDSCFQVLGAPGVWAIGDCAETPEPRHPEVSFAPTAQNAVREGILVADNIVQIIRGRTARPFRYKQIGSLAVISRFRGVAHVFGVNLRGFLAYLLWRGVYIAKCPTVSGRLLLIQDYIRLSFSRQLVAPAKPNGIKD